ncbi:unnamed protein product [Notodromas monacha]|uniref:Uncharacterized protein n=1 Tax=Notodromas monacha TaxID=399045 RepID=A0A7R9BGA5_9CRUS|nr:unnamed protein product [Notodromas monacha]CAG0914747.1 unnamed protein product [Notodromas monacha]
MNFRELLLSDPLGHHMCGDTIETFTYVNGEEIEVPLFKKHGGFLRALQPIAANCDFDKMCAVGKIQGEPVPRPATEPIMGLEPKLVMHEHDIAPEDVLRSGPASHHHPAKTSINFVAQDGSRAAVPLEEQEEIRAAAALAQKGNPRVMGDETNDKILPGTLGGTLSKTQVQGDTLVLQQVRAPAPVVQSARL